MLGVDKDAERLATVARRADAVQGARTRRRRSRARSRPAAARCPSAPPTPRRPTRSSSRSARRRSRTSRSTCPTSARCSTRCCRTCARATCSCCARPSRPHTTEFVAGYLEKHRGFTRRARTSSSPTCPSGSPPTASWRRSGRCRASSAASGEASADRAAQLFEPLGAPIVRTTPVQAELAKIWANILRYATFALPNLLMMDCERYGANVFEVIDLINRDYPRGGIAQPGLHRRHVPAQGLRVQRGALATRPACCSPSRACNETVPLFLVEGIKRRLGDLRERKVAVLGLAFKGDTDDERDSLSHKLIRLLERELADVAVHDPVVPTPTRRLRRGRHRRRRRRRGHEPLRLLEPRGARGDRAHGARRTASSSTPGTRSAPPRCSPTRARSPR